MPDRRHTWTQRVNIGRQRYYASFGEREDGTLGEVFVTGGVFGSYERGILDSLSRVASVALQCGISSKELAYALCGINFEPNGPVAGSLAVRSCLSVTDWLGSEIDFYYGDGMQKSEQPVQETETK